jgi:hypothetical protein
MIHHSYRDLVNMDSLKIALRTVTLICIHKLLLSFFKTLKIHNTLCFVNYNISPPEKVKFSHKLMSWGIVVLFDITKVKSQQSVLCIFSVLKKLNKDFNVEYNNMIPHCWTCTDTLKHANLQPHSTKLSTK